MNTATHPVQPEEIMAFFDGEIRGERASLISAHITECAECEAVFGRFRTTSGALSNWPASTTPRADIADRQLRETAARAAQLLISGPASFKVFIRTHRTGVGACVAAAVMLLLFVSTRVSQSPVRSLKTDALSKDHSVDQARLNERLIPMDSVRTTDELSVSRGGARVMSALGGSLGRLEEESRIVPMIARRVSLVIVAKDFSGARSALDSILVRHHGYAATLAASTEQDSARSLQASLRIPAKELNETVAELKSLGGVKTENQSGEEVTQQHGDLVARLKNSRETEARLQDILRNRTGKISDVLSVEQEIARVRGEVEQMEAEQKGLEHRVEFATVDLRLSEEYKAKLESASPSISTRFHNAFVAGFRSAAELIVSLLIFLAETLPSALLWLLILGPVLWLGWRRWRRSLSVASGTL